ncbi:MAG: ATP synthase F1 subunit epsilon [Candidatus Paceibacterota bacterium]
MKVEIITPKGIEFDQDVREIILPTQTGEIAVLPKHVPLISVLKAGAMKIMADSGNIEKEIEGGILEVGREKVVVLLKKL